MNVITREIETREAGQQPEVHVINERCVGCQECIIRCPTKALSIDPTTWLAVADNKLCVGCRQCQRTCPFSAITVDGPMVVTRRAKPHAEIGRPVGVGDLTEVRPGFVNLEEAVAEAERCLDCPDPTCVRGCPAHNDIPGFIAAIRNKDLGRAQIILAQTTCLPDVCSRVCDWATQCEGACSWALAGGEPVAIGKLERFVTDHSPVPPVNHVSQRGQGLSVGIMGSGPAGIAAAWELASAGASVTIYEKGADAGGVMQWGIPTYMLPAEVSRRPIHALVDAGVKMRTNTEVTPAEMERLLDTHDAVIAAYGAPVPERPALPGTELDGVIDATAFLKKTKTALDTGSLLPEMRGATVLVLGGSNTALDVARSALRLGAKPVVIHRREERFSRARPDEIAEAKGEGVEFRFATNIARLEGTAGKLKRAVLARTHQGKAEATPMVVKGSEQSIDAEILVLATGYGLDPDLSPLFGELPLRQPLSDRLLPDRRWQGSGIMAGGNPVGRLAWTREYGLRSSPRPKRDRLWLVGDALTGPSSVVGAMAQGRRAARAILERKPGRNRQGIIAL